MDIFVILLCALSSLRTIDSTLLSHSSWLKFGGNNQNTFHTSVTASAVTSLQWTYLTSNCVDGGIAVDFDNNLYFGNCDGIMYKLNRAGEVQWTYIVKESDVTGQDIYSTPAISSDGVIYFGSNNGGVYALSEMGALLWIFEATSFVASSPAISLDGKTIYVGSSDANMYAISKDGSLQWKYTTGNTVWSSPAIDTNGTIYFTSTDQCLYALESTGDLKWKYCVNSIIYSSPSLNAFNTVYFASYGGVLYALDIFTGSLQWSRNLFQTTEACASVTNDGGVVIAGVDGVILKYSRDGMLVWSHTPTPAACFYNSGTLDAADTYIIASECSNYIYAIDSDGNELWNYASAGSFYSTPSISNDGSIYIGSEDKRVYALGAIITTSPTLSPTAVTLSANKGTTAQTSSLAMIVAIAVIIPMFFCCCLLGGISYYYYFFIRNKKQNWRRNMLNFMDLGLSAESPRKTSDKESAIFAADENMYSNSIDIEMSISTESPQMRLSPKKQPMGNPNKRLRIYGNMKHTSLISSQGYDQFESYDQEDAQYDDLQHPVDQRYAKYLSTSRNEENEKEEDGEEFYNNTGRRSHSGGQSARSSGSRVLFEDFDDINIFVRNPEEEEQEEMMYGSHHTYQSQEQILLESQSPLTKAIDDNYKAFMSNDANDEERSRYIQERIRRSQDDSDTLSLASRYQSNLEQFKRKVQNTPREGEDGNDGETIATASTRSINRRLNMTLPDTARSSLGEDDNMSLPNYVIHRGIGGENDEFRGLQLENSIELQAFDDDAQTIQIELVNEYSPRDT